MHVHFPFPKHSAVAPREWTVDQRGFFLKDRHIAYRSCTPVCPVSFHVIHAETVTRSSWPRLVPMVAPIAEIKSGPEIPKCTTSITNHWHQCAGRLEEYQSCGSWGWSMQVKLSRNIFWPFQVSWAYLLPTDCFSNFRGESMWMRYTPNIALSNRLLQHGRPWLWVSKPIICSCASRRFHQSRMPSTASGLHLMRLSSRGLTVWSQHPDVSTTLFRRNKFAGCTQSNLRSEKTPGCIGFTEDFKIYILPSNSKVCKKKAQREKPGFAKLCLFYPECSLFSNSVIWGVVQL